MPQRFTEVPCSFPQVVNWDLNDLLALVIVMTPDVDDLLLCSEKKDSIYLALEEEGHKILKDKLPFARMQSII